MLLLLCLLLCVCCAFSGFAASSPDLTKTGSIQFRILSDYDPVPGGDLWLMRVCDVTKDSNGQLRYAWVPALQHLKFRPEDAFDFEHAKLIRDEALKNGASSQRIWIDADGRAAFQDLKPGIYLFYQTAAPDGYEVLPPFLVSIPMLDGDRWIFDVDVSPKPPVIPTPPTNPTVPTEPTRPTVPTLPTNPTTPTGPTTPTAPTNPTEPTNPTQPTVPTLPTEPTTPTNPTKPTNPDETTTKPDHSRTEPQTTQPQEPELPRTGQLKWPVAVLAGFGGLLLCCGAILRSAGKREEDE